MNEIKCPKCGERSIINESAGTAILEQVRGAESEKEIPDQKNKRLSDGNICSTE